jgi:hypothetical protein
MEQPEKIYLSAQEAQELMNRIESNQLSGDDLKTFSSLIAFNLWLQDGLSKAQLTIKRLKNLFGFKTEKKSLLNQ